MDMNGLFGLIDVVVLGFGVYALYSAFRLRRDGTITPGFLVMRDTDLDACKDLGGYADFMAPKLTALGGVMIVSSCVSLFNTYIAEIGTLHLAMEVVFLVGLFWYGVEARRAMKRFF